MKKTIINLQLFADAGSLVNSLTNGFVNAHTGATVPFDSANTLAPELKTFYDTELLENARIERYYGQFGMKKVLPANHGGSVEWRKFNVFKKATQLVEGVIPEAQKGGTTTVRGYIAQYGTFVAVTDVLEMRAYDNVILGYTEEMGASAAETQETLIRDALIGHTNKFFCDNVKEDGTFVKTPTSYSDMGTDLNGNTGMSTLTPKMVAKIVTHLKKKRVPTINGKYVAVIHPSVAHDLRQSKEWIEAHKYAAVTEIFNGEIGELHGCRFIENPFAPVCDGSLAPSGGKTYASMFFGKDAYGIIDPEQGGLEMIVKDKSQVGGPLNQFSTIGYKLETNGATILYPDRLVVAWSCSTNSDVDEATYDPEYYDVTKSPYYPA